jgi:hypothetical protein
MVRPIVISAAIVALTWSNGEAETLTSVGLENMAKLLRGDVRLIAMGDSFCAPYYARVPLAGLRVWPIPNISAMCGGATVNTQMIYCSAQCSPVSVIQSSDALGYMVERETLGLFYSLPVRGVQEIYTSDTFDDLGTNQLFQFKTVTAGNSHLANGVHGPFSELGDDIKFRFLYRCPSEFMSLVEEIKVLDFDEEVGIMQLRNGARPLWHQGEIPTKGTRDAVPSHINASAIDFPARNDPQLQMNLEQTITLAGTNQYFEPAGCVYYHHDTNGDREEGLYFNYVADDSWSYTGFGSDTAGETTHDKRFSLEQFTYWLDVTTLDRNQPTLFLWYLAPEILSYNTSFARMTNMIDQADQASALVGLNSVHHLIVISHNLNLSGDADQDHYYIQNQQSAAFNLAALRPSVGAASIYAATDGLMFTGSSVIPWLYYHGFDNFVFGSNSIDMVDFSNGDLLGSSNIHPKNPESAAFFASILGEIIRESGCPADIIPDGVIGVGELLRVINHLGDTFTDEDINNDGIVDIVDLLLVIDTWGVCWPVQAPFNTTAFRSTKSGQTPLTRDSLDQNESHSRGVVDR